MDLELQEHSEHISRIRRAKEKALDKILTFAYENYYKNDVNRMVNRFWDKSEIEIISNYIKKCKGGSYKYAFITVNPNSITNDNLTHFIKKIDKCCRKIWVERCLWCLEQRGDSRELADQGHGIHAHILLEIKNGKRSSEIRRETYNTFKHLVGNRNHVNIIFSMVDSNFVNYISGQKKDPSKQVKSEMDLYWRGLMELKPIYGNWFDINIEE